MSGYLENGQWHEGWYDTRKSQSAFIRTDSAFRNWVRADPSSMYPAQPGRYHLYVSLACPWAHRTVIARSLKKLESIVALSVVEPVMSKGWAFSEMLADHANGFQFMHQLYTAAQPDYTGRALVPVLWDTGTRSIVSNESADIVRMFDQEFAEWGGQFCRALSRSPARGNRQNQ